MLGKFSLEGIPPMPRGQPQIDVAFDVDANGILNVGAVEKSTGKEQKITITNDKGRLSQADIEKMVQDAEKFKSEDDKLRMVIESKNKLENYIYSLESISKDEKITLSDDDKASVEEKLVELKEWISLDHEEATEYDEKYKELEDLVKPIMEKIQAGMPGGMPGGMSDEIPSNVNDEGPNISEID